MNWSLEQPMHNTHGPAKQMTHMTEVGDVFRMTSTDRTRSLFAQHNTTKRRSHRLGLVRRAKHEFFLVRAIRTVNSQDEC